MEFYFLSNGNALWQNILLPGKTFSFPIQPREKAHIGRFNNTFSNFSMPDFRYRKKPGTNIESQSPTEEG